MLLFYPPFNLKKLNSYYDKCDVEEYLTWFTEWLREMVRITKPTSSVLFITFPNS
ncbi:DNA methyltransferase [Thermodesulfovibrio hydrogeniphilus]